MDKKLGSGNQISASYIGTITIGENAVPCAVLDDERRVFFQREIVGLLTGNKKGGLERYFQAKNLQPFVPEKYKGESWDRAIIKFKYDNVLAHGFEAEDLIDICYMYINARKANALLPSQEKLADTSEFIVKAFAKTGVIAVIDEATGYDKVRQRDALQAILDKYLKKEFAVWAKRFPDEFYQEIFRLKKWVYNPKSVKRPAVIGKYTNDIVYERLAPGILSELQSMNPLVDGSRRVRHHQFLTEDIGHPALAQHMYAVLALMRQASSWDSFYRSLQRAFPKFGEQIQFNIDDIASLD